MLLNKLKKDLEDFKLTDTNNLPTLLQAHTENFFTSLGFEIISFTKDGYLECIVEVKKDEVIFIYEIKLEHQDDFKIIYYSYYTLSEIIINNISYAQYIAISLDELNKFSNEIIKNKNNFTEYLLSKHQIELSAFSIISETLEKENNYQGEVDVFLRNISIKASTDDITVQYSNSNTFLINLFKQYPFYIHFHTYEDNDDLNIIKFKKDWDKLWNIINKIRSKTFLYQNQNLLDIDTELDLFIKDTQTKISHKENITLNSGSPNYQKIGNNQNSFIIENIIVSIGNNKTFKFNIYFKDNGYTIVLESIFMNVTTKMIHHNIQDCLNYLKRCITEIVSFE